MDVVLNQDHSTFGKDMLPTFIQQYFLHVLHHMLGQYEIPPLFHDVPYVTVGGQDTNDFLNILRDMNEDQLLNMTFSTAEVAEDFIKMYSTVHGFSIRKRDIQKRRNGECVMRKWICSNEGATIGSNLSKANKRVRSSTRTGCNCFFKVRVEDNQQWKFIAVELKHNHEMVRNELSYFMRERRNVSDEDITFVRRMLDVGFRQCDIMLLLVHVSGGHSGVGFLMKDLNNKKLKEDSIGSNGGFDSVIAYLHSRRNSDTGMAFYTFVENNIVSRIYWADGTSIADYQAFGDVIAFDSTFKTNKYGMQMVIIVGVNHHHQTTVFGATLMASETIADYNWLLRTHTEVMGGKHPISVVTDADNTMIASVREVWPGARHRLCLWHFSRNIAVRVQNPGMQSRISSFMYNSRPSEEVEEQWTNLMKQSGTISTRWLDRVYTCKHMWWQTYLQGHFWAELRSTQRCERMHRFMKGYVNANNKLHDFVSNFEHAVEDIRHKEYDEDFKSSKKRLRLITMLRPLEEDARRLYTLNSFCRVRVELQKESKFYVEDVLDGNISKVYTLSCYDGEHRYVQVSSAKSSVQFSCSCFHFETFGFPCSHLFHVAKIEGLVTIPTHLIKERWTMTAKTSQFQAMSHQEYGVNVDDLRQGILMTACRRMCSLAGKSDKTFRKLRKKIETWTDKLEVGCVDDEGKKKDDDRRQVVFHSSSIKCVVYGNQHRYGVSTKCAVNACSDYDSADMGCNENSNVGQLKI